MAMVERCAAILRGIHEAGQFEHGLVLLVREREALAMHVPPDGTSWFGVVQDDEDALSQLQDLAQGIASSEESDVTSLARSFDVNASEMPIKSMMSGVLLTLAEPIDCQSAVLLLRDAGEDAAWLAARYEPGSVRYMEAPPDTFNRELLRLHDLATEPVDGTMPKASLRAAEVGASYNLDVSPEGSEILESQRIAFREKFGRDPGPEDPIFFDPEADTPQPFPLEKIKQMEAVMAEHGMDEEWFIRGQAEREEQGALQRKGRIGRNDPCWCGSGKKFKRCHGS
jgi:hypothetical protein